MLTRVWAHYVSRCCVLRFITEETTAGMRVSRIRDEELIKSFHQCWKQIVIGVDKVINQNVNVAAAWISIQINSTFNSRRMTNYSHLLYGINSYLSYFVNLSILIKRLKHVKVRSALGLISLTRNPRGFFRTFEFPIILFPCACVVFQSVGMSRKVPKVQG